MKHTKVALTIALLAVFFYRSALPQSSAEFNDLKKEIEALKAGQNAIQRDLQRILDFFKSRQAQAADSPTPENPTTISIEGGAIKGDPKAKITLIEFTDYQCPFCSRHFRETMPQIVNDYVNTGKVRYVLRDLPLETIHPFALKAAEAANCAGEQGKYWEMHDRLFANQNALATPQLSDHAKAIGLDVTEFNKCVESGKFAEKVRKDVADAQQAGVSGTPTFFIGLTDPKGSDIKAVRKIVGAQNYAAFKTALDTLAGTEQ